MDSNSRYQLQPNSGLLRFRSALGSPHTNLKQGEGGGGGGANNGNQWGNVEPERLVLRFMNSSETESNDDYSASPRLREFVDDKPDNHKAANESSAASPSFLSRMNSQQQGYSSSAATCSVMEQHKGFNSHLLRQSSSPAAHFSNIISFQNGYDTTKVVGNYGGVNGNDDEHNSLSMNKLKNQISFPPRSPSSLGMFSHASKMGSEDVGTTSRDDNDDGDARYYGLRFPYDSWNETSQLSDKHIESNRERNGDDRLLSHAQNGELGNQVHRLSHHLSLPVPRKSSEFFAMDNLLEFTDSVPTNVRAKRGFATHPRSIAERVRRTRISERIRKLQELVPNLDKQTSTAEMLDLAAVYVNDLQKQLKTLSEKRAKCKCIRMQKSETNQIA